MPAARAPYHSTFAKTRAYAVYGAIRFIDKKILESVGTVVQ